MILRYVVPVLAGAPPAVKGRLSTDIYVQGRGAAWPDLCRGLAGRGEVAIKPVELDSTPLIAEISEFADLAGTRAVGSIHTDFVYKARRITTDHFNLDIGARAHDDVGLDGPRRPDRLPDEDRGAQPAAPRPGEAPPRRPEAGRGIVDRVSLRGTVNRMVVQVNGVPIDRNLLRETRLRPDDREKIRQIGRQALDRFLR